ncbi:MAG: YgjV family protein [Lachnospiraceae bacterium]|nr:YgjV family protein [Lachnospiraceae bacterium]
MNYIIIGNIVSFAGCILMVLAGLIKRKNNIIKLQCAQFTLMGAANIILGGITGAIANGISLIRNLFTLKFRFTLPVKLVFIAVQAAVSIIFNNHGIIGYLPVAATIIFTWFLDTKSDLTLKIVMTVTQVMWLVYDTYIMNYVGTGFDTAALIADGIGIRMLMTEKKKTE